MGHVFQAVKLAAASEANVTMLVDTGATFSLISPALADRLGVARLPRTTTITLANGQRIEAQVGTVLFEIGDRRSAGTVVIADCDEPLLGIETLEAMGLAVDPSSGSLKPTRAYTVRLGGLR
jgi:clan AA aspartic protease